MKYDRRQKHSHQSNRILLDTIYRETGNDGASKTELNRIREYIYQVLDYWTVAGYIPGYKVAKEGNKIRGIDIILKTSSARGNHRRTPKNRHALALFLRYFHPETLYT